MRGRRTREEGEEVERRLGWRKVTNATLLRCLIVVSCDDHVTMILHTHTHNTHLALFSCSAHAHTQHTPCPLLLFCTRTHTTHTLPSSLVLHTHTHNTHLALLIVVSCDDHVTMILHTHTHNTHLALLIVVSCDDHVTMILHTLTHNTHLALFSCSAHAHTQHTPCPLDCCVM